MGGHRCPTELAGRPCAPPRVAVNTPRVSIALGFAYQPGLVGPVIACSAQPKGMAEGPSPGTRTENILNQAKS